MLFRSPVGEEPVLSAPPQLHAGRRPGLRHESGVGAGVGALCTRLIGPRAVWVAAAMLVLALAAIVIETATLSRVETTDDHSEQEDGPGHHRDVRGHLGRRRPGSG